MLSFQYINDTKTYNVSFEKLDKNHVKILGDIPIKTNGFILELESRKRLPEIIQNIQQCIKRLTVELFSQMMVLNMLSRFQS